MTTIHTRQLQQYTQDNYNNTHKTTTKLQQYTQDNYNNTHKTTTTIHKRQLQQYTQDNYNTQTTTTIHTDNYNNTHRQLQQYSEFLHLEYGILFQCRPRPLHYSPLGLIVHQPSNISTLSRLSCWWLTDSSAQRPCLLPKFLHLFKQLPAFHETRPLITLLTTACHLSILSGTWIQSTPCHTVDLNPFQMASSSKS
jgi:hypothetical protein